MATFAEQLARLRVAAATGVVPREVAAWAVEELEELAPAGERIDARNTLLREAAALVSGSRWAKARRLERELGAAAAGRGRTAAGADPVRDLVVRALQVDPAAALSARQLARILGLDTPGLTCQRPPVGGVKACRHQQPK
ncbi:MAG: hypothetical protein NDI82_02280 [Anaeromyxobacteraceae bacterium]|nr:hypothetical protein [Anaeromyxobacteraceae bacterium]